MTPRPVPPEPVADDLEHLASRLADARRVLVTGLEGADVKTAAAACSVAEALGAAVDFGTADLDRPDGPVIARAGAVTADPAEMRDRADLVILWGGDQAADLPTVAAFIAARATIVRMPPAGATPIDAARLLHHLLRDGAPPATRATWIEACIAARDAIRGATCVAIVTGDFTDPLGIETWAISLLVREIAHMTPAFEIPLPAADHAAAAVCTWRYGAAGAIICADRSGARFLPAEASARRLIERHEVDCVLAVGRLAATVETAIARSGDGIDVIRVAAEPSKLGDLQAALAKKVPGGDR